MKKMIVLLLACIVNIYASEQMIIKHQFTMPCAGGYALITDYVNGARRVTRYSHSYGDLVTFTEMNQTQGEASEAWMDNPLLADPRSTNPQERAGAQIYQCYHGDCDG